jgi:hypothetical protein
MILSILASILLSGADTLRVYNSHDHPMMVLATIGDKSIDLGPVAPGDTAKFVITIPTGVTQLLLRAHPLDDPLGQITFTLDIKPEKALFWSFDDS